MRRDRAGRPSTRSSPKSARIWDRLDFLVHAIAFSDKDQLTGRYVDTTADNFTKTMLISCYSLTAVAQRAEKLMTDGGSILTLTYYGAEKVMPHYNVMGVAKAALEASVRYLAVDLGGKGIRVNAISSGPIKTLAASGIGDFRYILKWNELNAPLKRTVDLDEVGDAGVFLLSDLGRVGHRRDPPRRCRLPRRRHEGGRRPRHRHGDQGRRLTAGAIGARKCRPMLPTLVFLRHGETDWNVEGRLQGQRDIPLNDKGRGQARRNGEAIAAAIPEVARLRFRRKPAHPRRARRWRSPALAMGLDPSAYRLDDRLREITFGDWEGLHHRRAAVRSTPSWSPNASATSGASCRRAARATRSSSNA